MRGSESGSMSVFMVIFAVAVFLLAGLLVDGGAAINARLRAADVAEQAARAGANMIDEEKLHQGVVQVLEGEACGKADEVVAAHAGGAAITNCAPAADAVTVGVEVSWEAFFLAVLGFGGGTMRAEATASPETGEDPAIP